MPYRNPDAPIMKLYYSVDDVAKICCVTQQCVRDTCKYLNLNISRNRRNFRRFNNDELNMVKNFIFLTKHKGFSVKGAVQEIKINGFLPESELNHLIEFYKLQSPIYEKKNKTITVSKRHDANPKLGRKRTKSILFWN